MAESITTRSIEADRPGPPSRTGLALALVAALGDRTLRQELAGYARYAQRVRYRLIPGLW